MSAPKLRALCLACVPALVVWGLGNTGVPRQDEAAAEPDAPTTVHVHYLEVVTPTLDATCRALAKLHDVAFGEPVPALGNARTAPLAGGGRLGVRAPLRPDEEPVVRPYVLVDDIESAVAAAEAQGGVVALPPTEIPGEGRCAIFFLGDIEHGLWEL